MLKKLREPVNSLTHWIGAVLALAGLIALLIVGWGTPAKVVSLKRHLSHGARER